jgi:hypothetical protein
MQTKTPVVSENAHRKIGYSPPTNALRPSATLRCRPVIHLLHWLKKLKKQTCLALGSTASLPHIQHQSSLREKGFTVVLQAWVVETTPASSPTLLSRACR